MYKVYFIENKYIFIYLFFIKKMLCVFKTKALLRICNFSLSQVDMKVGEEVRGYGRSSTRRLLDPAYTPDIAHLVHRGGGPPPQAESKAAKSARARLAEVLSLTRTATRLRQVTQRKVRTGITAINLLSRIRDRIQKGPTTTNPPTTTSAKLRWLP